VTEAASPGPPGTSLRWSLADTVGLLSVTVFAAAIRGYRLLEPNGLVFDEFYYGPDACRYVRESAELCGFGELTYFHPPLAKWLMSLGIQTFGPNRLGWRSAALVAGVVTVIAVYLFARRAFDSTWIAVFASGLLALDFMHIVHSRIAMLDVFVTCFATLAAAFFVFDRSDTRTGFYRPWRLAAGIAAGAAVASKWSGALILIALIGLTLVWDLRGRRARISSALASTALWLVIVPLVVYSLTFIGRIDGSFFAAPWTTESWTSQLVIRQTRMASYHSGIKEFLEGEAHPYSSPAWTWLLLKRPITYHFSSEGNVYKHVLNVGNPVVWWLAIPALLYLTASVLTRRSRPHESTVVVLFGAALLPWVVLPLGGPYPYIFYALLAVPFMCVAIAATTARLTRVWRHTAMGAISLMAFVALVFYAPVLYAQPIERSSWSQRMLFRDCRYFNVGSLAERLREARLPIATGEIKGVAPGVIIPTRTRPTGWCWI
jgi:dolichyl-phosphate-mannose--protein O-mannosyl transferase